MILILQKCHLTFLKLSSRLKLQVLTLRISNRIGHCLQRVRHATPRDRTEHWTQWERSSQETVTKETHPSMSPWIVLGSSQVQLLWQSQEYLRMNKSSVKRRISQTQTTRLDTRWRRKRTLASCQVGVDQIQAIVRRRTSPKESFQDSTCQSARKERQSADTQMQDWLSRLPCSRIFHRRLKTSNSARRKASQSFR